MYGIELQKIYENQDTSVLQRVIELLETSEICPPNVMATELAFDILPQPIQDVIFPLLPQLTDIHNRGAATLLNDLCHRKVAPSCFTDLLLYGFVSSDESLPPWLTDAGRRRLRKRTTPDHLQTFEGNIMAFEAEGGPGFDLISLSNIFDWTTAPVATAAIADIVRRHLRPGGYILFRRAFGGCRAIAEAASGGAGLSAEDASLTAALPLLERTPFFYRNQDSVVAWRPGPSLGTVRS